MRIPLVFAVLGMALLVDGDSFFDKFRYGVEMIERILNQGAGSNFSGFFSIFKSKGEDDLRKNLLAAIVSSIGGNQEEMARAGVKISILLAKTISESFPSGRAGRSGREKEFSPLDTLIRQPEVAEVRELMSAVRDPELTKKIVGGLCRRGCECFGLLICKISPFVRGMQESLIFFSGGGDTSGGPWRRIWAESKPLERMYLFLPDMKEFLSNGDACDEKYPTCLY